MRRVILIVLLSLLCFGLVSCRTKQEVMPPDNSYVVFIALGEGDWPVEEYQSVDSEIMDIHFEYPEGWGGTFSVLDSVKDEYKEVFGDTFVAEQMPEKVDKYIGITVRRDIPIQERRLPTSAELMEVEKIISIAGINCIDLDYGKLSDSHYSRYVDGDNGKYLIMMQFSYDSGRTAEEYREVIDRLLESFEVNFEKY
jgi:hypothetical protein